jgi:hypothetical protein
VGAAASGGGEDWARDLDLDLDDQQEEVHWQVPGLAGRLAYDH